MQLNMKKKLIREVIDDSIGIDGPVDKIIDQLNQYKAKYPNHKLELDRNWEGDLQLVGYREETDGEYADRIAEEAEAARLKIERAEKRKQRQLEKAAKEIEKANKTLDKERELYEILKKKYGEKQDS